MVFVAFLRGINVGGKHVLPMKDLTALLTGLDCGKVRTYIQSGNAAFLAPPGKASVAELQQTLGRALAKRFGFEVPVVVRTPAQLEAALKANPFRATGAEPEQLYVGFLAERPAAPAVKALDPKRSPGDSFQVLGNDVFLHLPKGGAKTKLTNAWFDAGLKTVCTMRNVRTVQALVDLAGEIG